MEAAQRQCQTSDIRERMSFVSSSGSGVQGWCGKGNEANAAKLSCDPTSRVLTPRRWIHSSSLHPLAAMDLSLLSSTMNPFTGSLHGADSSDANCAEDVQRALFPTGFDIPATIKASNSNNAMQTAAVARGCAMPLRSRADAIVLLRFSVLPTSASAFVATASSLLFVCCCSLSAGFGSDLFSPVCPRPCHQIQPWNDDARIRLQARSDHRRRLARVDGTGQRRSCSAAASLLLVHGADAWIAVRSVVRCSLLRCALLSTSEAAL